MQLLPRLLRLLRWLRCWVPRFAARAAVVVALLTAACSEPTAPVRVTAVTVEAPRTVLLWGPGGGESIQLAATARDADGEGLAGRTITWSLSGTGIVTVSPTGVVTAVGLGTVSVRATSSGIEGAATITVVPVPVALVELPDAPVGLVRSPLLVDRVQLVPTLRDSTGAPLPSQPVQWISRAPSVVRVESDGYITAMGGGSGVVVATVNGRSDSVVVTVTEETRLPGAADIRIVDVQWTQGMQSVDGSIAMLAGGRAAVVNIVVSSPLGLAVLEEYVLRLYSRTGELIWADTAIVALEAGTSTAASPTAQILVPTNRVEPGTLWQVVRDVRGVVQDADPTNDRFPEGAPVELNVITPPVLRLRFVPITLTSHGNATGNISATNLPEYLRVVRQFGPVGRIDPVVAPPFATSLVFGTGSTGGAGPFWTALIQQLDAARVASETDADAYWIAIVAPPPGFTFVTFGGMAFIPSSGTSIGPGSRTLSLVNVGWFTRESQSRELVMHELGHALGRLHAPSCGAGGPDPNFPDPSGLVGVGGHDTYSFGNGVSNFAPAVDRNRYDIMGYCSPTWMSSYNYGAIVTFRGREEVALRAPPTRRRVVLVQGNATSTSVELNAPRTFLGTPTADDPAGAWEIEGRDASGALLFRYRAALGRWDHLEDVRPLSVAIPLSESEEAVLETIVVTGPGGLRASRSVRAGTR